MKNKRELDYYKEEVRVSFAKFDTRKQQRDSDQYKPAHLSKQEIKKLLGAIIISNNDQCENYFKDFDKDQDGYLNINETIGMVMAAT